MENQKIKFSGLLSKKQLISVGATFVVGLLILVALFFMPFSSSDEAIKFKVKEGTSFNKVLDDLEKEGIIGNKTLAKISGFLLGVDKKMRPGIYTIPQSISYTGLMSIFASDDFEKPVFFELYSGITINGIANRAKQLKLLSADSLALLLRDSAYARSKGIDANNFEGYLFPGTIEVYRSSSAKEILEQLFDLQAKIFSQQLIDDINKGSLSKHEILTLASIISRESRYTDEMPRVSGVYHNRLNKNMKLQADPTVQYALPELKNRITAKDLKVDSPYNTYKYAGLPPGPIGNPSKEAIYAAVYPEKHEYLFFVAGKEGRHIFSKTYEEHKKYAKEYHQWLDSLNITQ